MADDPAATLFDTPPADGGTPPAQDPVPQADAPPAWLGAATAQIASAIRDGLRQDPATTAQAAPAGPRTWYETLSDEQRQKINEQLLLNAAATSAYVAQQESEFAAQRMIRQADPLLSAQGDTFVQLFKARKAQEPYYAQIAPLFDKMLVGADLRLLVNMTPSGRESELDLRWRAAKADVQDRILANPPKPPPTLLAGGGVSAAEPPPAGDAWLDAMGAQYGFTEEQKRALEAANKE